MDEKRSLRRKDNEALTNHPSSSRREPHLKTLLATLILILLALHNLPLSTFFHHTQPDFQSPPFTLQDRAHKILRENPLIDGHNDLLITLRFAYPSGIYNENFTTPFETTGNATGMVDLPRLRAGHVGGSFWSAFVPCPADPLDWSDAAYAPYVKMTLEQLDLFGRLRERYPRFFTPAATAASAEEAWQQHGTLVSPVAIEGLHQIGNSLATLRLYHSLGVRYATLTWNCHNRYADAAVTPGADGQYAVSEPYHHGLSAAGREAVLEMNRLGMLVDLAHVSVESMRDVLGFGKAVAGETWGGSVAAPIFSHSSAWALCPHSRNVPDEILWMVRERGALVMVNFSPDFVSCRKGNSSSGLPDLVEETNTLEHVVDHLVYIGELIGYEHVGLGSDFDGIEAGPRGLEDVSKFPALVEELLRRGVSEQDAGKIVGRNLLRVWREADEVAARLQETMHPTEDELSTPWLEVRGR